MKIIRCTPGNEMNQSNASKLILKIENPLSMVENMILGFENEM